MNKKYIVIFSIIISSFFMFRIYPSYFKNNSVFYKDCKKVYPCDKVTLDCDKYSLQIGYFFKNPLRRFAAESKLVHAEVRFFSYGEGEAPLGKRTRGAAMRPIQRAIVPIEGAKSLADNEFYTALKGYHEAPRYRMQAELKARKKTGYEYYSDLSVISSSDPSLIGKVIRVYFGENLCDIHSYGLNENRILGFHLGDEWPQESYHVYMYKEQGVAFTPTQANAEFDSFFEKSEIWKLYGFSVSTLPTD